MTSRILLAVGIGCIGHALNAQEYQGASTVLKKLAEQAGSQAEPEKEDPVKALAQKCQEFGKTAATQKPEEAAAQWLALLDAYLTIPNTLLYAQSGSYEGRLSLMSVLQALPPSNTWDAMPAILSAKKSNNSIRDDALKLLVAALRGDAASRAKAVSDIENQIKAAEKMDENERENLEQHLRQVTQALESLTASPQGKLKTFQRDLDEGEKKAKSQPDEGAGFIMVPDLARITDEAQATVLLVRVFKAGFENISFDGDKTVALAARVALKNISSLKKPVWSLITGIQQVPLYEALLKKFPKRDNDWERHQADAIYLLSLIANDRAKDAVKFIQDVLKQQEEEASFLISLSALEQMQRKGLGAQVLTFLREVLSSDPAMPFWKPFVELSAREGSSAAALQLFEAALAKPDLTPAARLEVQSHYYLALLAADKLDEGIEVLRELVKAGPHPKGKAAAGNAEEARKSFDSLGVNMSPEMLLRLQSSSNRGEDDGASTHIHLLSRLVTIGRLLKKPPLVEEGLAATEAACARMQSAGTLRSDVLALCARLMVENNQGVRAESLIVQYLLAKAKPVPGSRRSYDRDMGSATAALAQLYEKAGRHADVIALLDKSPYWEAPDLSAVRSAGLPGAPIALIAARSLAATGRKEEARRLLHRVLQDHSSNDAAYQFLLELGTEGSIEAELDKLAQLDRFQERPLIWKAKVQLDAGRVDDAEKTIRAAIAIDPSDGEQGKGDRMRAYAILADILDKKGNKEEAKIFRGAVTAIRKSEDADDWWTAGLLSRAVAMYEDALGDFADAYCIQSRLALRYSEMGQFDKAEEHYRRAFALMPSSFGRIESHCFGCEGAFTGERAQKVADEVFADLMKKMPDRPQVFYLVGYLRQSQNRFADAATFYRQAVKLDPDYFNAWRKLTEIADDAQLPPEEVEAAVINIFRLDPSGQHGRVSLDKIANLRLLWDTLVATEASLPKSDSGPVYPLAASTAALEKMEGSRNVNARMRSQSEDLRQRFLEHPVVNGIGDFIEQVSRRE